MEAAGISAVLHVLEDGEKAVQFFEDADRDPNAACPDVVILDLNLPRFKGSDVLRRMRASARCASVPVIVVTSSDAVRDRAELAELGANEYFTKPSEYLEYMKLGGRVRALLNIAAPSQP